MGPIPLNLNLYQKNLLREQMGEMNYGCVLGVPLPISPSLLNQDNDQDYYVLLGIAFGLLVATLALVWFADRRAKKMECGPDSRYHAVTLWHAICAVIGNGEGLSTNDRLSTASLQISLYTVLLYSLLVKSNLQGMLCYLITVGREYDFIKSIQDLETRPHLTAFYMKDRIIDQAVQNGAFKLPKSVSSVSHIQSLFID